MYKKRSSIEVIASILEACKKGDIKKTRIMFITNLNPRSFYRYIEILKSKGFISLNTDNKYELTPKGYDYLNRANEYLEIKRKLQILKKELDFNGQN
ncbi:MAG: winged helix-turn-helix domain-containing protein [Saccharolobus sp.]|uniref:winged helix-turn-helix domain-containing protein n=1 Tax=Saccharolobus TaxID=2100760 RepID=UPI001F114D8D|nr:winged helix-turn-helix domain-containing protein [Saccharolobus shibatae]MCH4816150.1 winged helix-turn-helix domain-containing protein [Saccharolobus shibatae]